MKNLFRETAELIKGLDTAEWQMTALTWFHIDCADNCGRNIEAATWQIFAAKIAQIAGWDSEDYKVLCYNQQMTAWTPELQEKLDKIKRERELLER
jgi:hypothetical protein